MLVCLASSQLVVAAQATGWDITSAVAAVIAATVIVVTTTISSIRWWLNRRPHFTLQAAMRPEEVVPLTQPYRESKALTLPPGDAWSIIVIARSKAGLEVWRCRIRLVQRHKWRRWRWQQAPRQIVDCPSIWSTDAEMQTEFAAVRVPQMSNELLLNGWRLGTFPHRVLLGDGDSIRFRVGIEAGADWRGALELQLPDATGKWKGRRMALRLEYREDSAAARARERLWPEVFGVAAAPTSDNEGPESGAAT